MKTLILLFTMFACTATDLETEIQQLAKYSKHIKTLIVEYFDYLLYDYLQLFYPDLMENYTGRHKLIRKYKFGNFFFVPVENFQWRVHNYRGVYDKTFTDKLKISMENIIDDASSTTFNIKEEFKEIHDKTHKQMIDSSDENNSAQLSKQEHGILHELIIKCIQLRDSEIILKFFIMMNGSVAASYDQTINVAQQARWTYNNDNVLYVLQCLKKLDLATLEIANDFVSFSDLERLKCFVIVFGKEILNSRYMGWPLLNSLCWYHYRDLQSQLSILRWMIQEQAVDPTKKCSTLFGSIGPLEILGLSGETMNYDHKKKRIHDETRAYLQNEIQVAEAKKSFKRKIKDFFVNRQIQIIATWIVLVLFYLIILIAASYFRSQGL